MAPERSKENSSTTTITGNSFMSASFPYEQLIARKLEELPLLPEMADAIWARITAELDADPGDDFGGDEFDGGGGGEPGGSGPGSVSGPDGGVKAGPSPNGKGAAPLSGVSGWYYLLLLGGIALFLIFIVNKPGLEAPEIDHPDMFKLPAREDLILPARAGDDAERNPANTGKTTLGSDEPAAPKRSEGRTGASENASSGGRDLVPQDVPNNREVILPEKEILPETGNLQVVPPENELTGRSDNTRLDSVSTTPPSNNRQAGGRKRPTGIKGVNSTDYRIVPQIEKKDSL
jgi:hypothetical protein